MKRKISVYNVALVSIVFLIIIIGSLIVFVSPVKKPVRKMPEVVNNEPVAASKPVFRKDGELRFIDVKSNKVINTIDIEVADDDAEREYGLMNRDSMGENEGMVFMMEAEEIQSFWMKNTILSLDIIYADSERRIVSIHKNCTPFSLDQIISAKPALYVVEVNAGFVEKYGIRVGDMISF